jgi:cytochrome P450
MARLSHASASIWRPHKAAYISGTLLEAGSDTTSSTLYGFVLAMFQFPEVQKKARRSLIASLARTDCRKWKIWIHSNIYEVV